MNKYVLIGAAGALAMMVFCCMIMQKTEPILPESGSVEQTRSVCTSVGTITRENVIGIVGVCGEIDDAPPAQGSMRISSGNGSIEVAYEASLEFSVGDWVRATGEVGGNGVFIAESIAKISKGDIVLD